MPGPGPAWRQGPGGPWTPTSQNFIQHQLHHALNLWRLGHPAVFHLESQSDGRAKLNLSFCLPPPSEIIPPPPPSFPTSTFTPSHPFPSQRPIIPLFPRGEVPTFQPRHPPQELPRSKRKSYRRSVLYKASKATPNLPPALPGTLRWKCANLLQQAVSAFTKPNPPLPQHPQAAPTFPPQLQQAVSANTKPSPPLPPGATPPLPP